MDQLRLCSSNGSIIFYFAILITILINYSFFVFVKEIYDLTICLIYLLSEPTIARVYHNLTLFWYSVTVKHVFAFILISDTNLWKTVERPWKERRLVCNVILIKETGTLFFFIVWLLWQLQPLGGVVAAVIDRSNSYVYSQVPVYAI